MDNTKIDFNYFEYINNYDDLRFFNYSQAYLHYLNYGMSEGRICRDIK